MLFKFVFINKTVFFLSDENLFSPKISQYVHINDLLVHSSKIQMAFMKV